MAEGGGLLPSVIIIVMVARFRFNERCHPKALGGWKQEVKKIIL